MKRSRLLLGRQLAGCAIAALLFAILFHPAHGANQPASPPPQAQSAAASPFVQKHVLVLYSTVYLPAYRRHSAALLASLEQAGVSSANIHYELLDLGRNNTPAYRDSLASWIREKYATLKMDAIITVDGPAQDFILNQGSMLFPDAPVISVLAPLALTDPFPGRRIIQIPARGDFAGTVETAMQLFPKTKQVYFISGDAEVEKQWLVMAQVALAPWFDKLHFEFSDPSTYDQVLQTVSALPPDSIILYLSFYRDISGSTYVPRDVAKEIARISPVPVFGVYDTLLGVGVVGGSMFSYEFEGRHSAELTLDIMSGKLQPTEQLTVLPCLVRPMFDWKQLERWDVSMRSFPEESVFINQPPTIWGQYREIVIGTCAVFLALVALITALLASNRRRKIAETAARLSEARVRVLVEQAPEAIIVTDVDRNLTVDANRNAFRLFGCETTEQLNRRVELYFTPEQPDRLPLAESLRNHRDRALAGEEVLFERAIRNAHGENLICEVRLVRLPSANNRLLRASWIDITERKRAEEVISASLREKEILLREIHHRVKNNLQIISSLMTLQEEGVDHPAALEALAVCRGRVSSMAVIHEQIYRTPSLSRIDVADYLQQFLPRIVSVFKGVEDISLELDIAPILLTLDQAIPFGLIINELTTNALKHAFRGREYGTIRLSASLADEMVTLVIEDDGNGLPENFDPTRTSSLGLQIVSMLTKQLHGTLSIEPASGTRFRFQFPLCQPGHQDGVHCPGGLHGPASA